VSSPSIIPIWTREDAAILAKLAATHPTYPAAEPGMRPRRMRRLIWLAGLGGILAGALAGTGIARADTPAEVAGHICNRLHAGQTLAQVLDNYLVANPDESLNTARTFIAASVIANCPEMLPSGPIGDTYRA
jgi:hypothetical protein